MTAGGELTERSPARTVPRARWPLLLLAAAGVIALGIWHDAPSERSIQVRVAASAAAREVELTWLDQDGSALRHSIHHFGGQPTERIVRSQVTVTDGVYRLDIRVRGDSGDHNRQHRVDLVADEVITVFAP